MSDKNLTGEQIQQVLDLFLYKALEPIITKSSAFDNQIVYLLGLITRNRKRKLSSISRSKAAAYLAKALVTSDSEEKLKLFRAARIERNFIHVFIRSYLDMCSSYEEEYVKYMFSKGTMKKMHAKRLDLIAKDLKTDRKSLFIIVKNSTVALNYFYEYRKHILSHYVQMASSQAKSFVSSNPNNNYDFFDCRQGILRSVLIAIDKYDSSKGALTSYINWWVLNAQTCGVSDHEYGIAYIVPQAQRRKMANKQSSDVNFSVSLDTLVRDEDDGDMHSLIGDGSNFVEDIQAEQIKEKVRYIVKCLDRKGVLRLSMDIGEVFSKKELRKMKASMLNRRTVNTEHKKVKRKAKRKIKRNKRST